MVDPTHESSQNAGKPGRARQRILEGIVTTVNEDGTTNISPMGATIDETMSHFVLRPYQTSTTFRNLGRLGEGVLHVTDDVELLARAAVGQVVAQVSDASDPRRRILTDTCRWYVFQVTELDSQQARTNIGCQVVDQGHRREFFGFNRAKHAVVEAAILATRVGILDDEQIRNELCRLSILVEKTGGDSEHRAFDFLVQHVADKIGLE